MRAFVVLGGLLCLSASAVAEEDPQLKDLEQVLKNTAPAKGVDKAPLAGPGWCANLKKSSFFPGAVRMSLDSYYNYPDAKTYELFGAAKELCDADPKKQVIQKVAQEILQLWMNRTGHNAKDAAESMNAYLDEASLEAAHKKLCAHDKMKIDKEVGGPELMFWKARNDLFDCGEKASSVSVAMAGLVPWLDSSSPEPDELVRLAFVWKEAESIVKANTPDYFEKRIVAYAIDQVDFRLLDPKKVMAFLEQEPYKGNIYAIVSIKEALAASRIYLLQIEDEVKKRADKDPDWKELLVTAPKKGIDAYNAGAAKWKAELQRSAEFEQKAFGPSRKAMAGCLPVLKKDFVAVTKSMKKDTVTDFIAQMNESPVAGLLLRRLFACMAVDGDDGVARASLRIEGIRVLRGPRAAAYYATLDALGKIRADRAKFSIEENEIPIDRTEILEELLQELARGAKPTRPNDYGVWTGKGVVKTAKKGKDGLAVVFAKDKQKVWQESCQTLNRIIMFDHDGRPIYDRKCKGSVVVSDVSPDPINVPLDIADGVAPGKYVSFGVSNSQERRISLPYEVYADKQGKKLIAWYSILL
jgi:hypothetical protein